MSADQGPTVSRFIKAAASFTGAALRAGASAMEAGTEKMTDYAARRQAQNATRQGDGEPPVPPHHCAPPSA